MAYLLIVHDASGLTNRLWKPLKSLEAAERYIEKKLADRLDTRGTSLLTIVNEETGNIERTFQMR